MCGINGIIAYEGGRDYRLQVEQMNAALQHRGPDFGSVWNEAGIALGHRRLSIIDLSEGGHQPMTTPDGRYTLVYNGELYNYQEVKQDLANTYTFQTASDTEVLLAAFVQWGPACLSRFNGMFAFCVWDNQTKRYFLARDRMGIKPLYYHSSGEELLFSSEVRGILASKLIQPKLNPEGLVDYLRYQTVHAPATMLKEVYMLQPGQFLQGRGDEWTIGSYWDIAQPKSVSVPKEPTALRKQIKQTFFESVERRLIADVPFGAFLSGGIDSSAVVGAMSEVATGKVKTFSVTFEEEEYSEARYARMIAEKFKTEHQEIRLTPDDFLGLLPDALQAMDHPSGDGPNTYVVSKVTRESGITVALSGLGGDELFAGYSIFQRSLQLERKRWLQSFPKFLRRATGQVLKLYKPGVASSKIAQLLELDYFDLSYTYPISRQVLLDPLVYELLNKQKLPPNAVRNIGAGMLSFGKAGFESPLLSQVSMLEMSTYMQNVLLRDTDQMSMAHALEVRVPFLDHKLVELLLAVNDTQKYPHTPKQLLTESLGKLLPREIIDRPKMGFVLPYADWMKTVLKQFCEERIKGLAAIPYMDEEVLERLWQQFLKGDPNVSWSRIWMLVVLQNWIEKNHVEV